MDAGHGGAESLETLGPLLRDGVEAGARNATSAALTGRLPWDGLDVGMIMITEPLLCRTRVRCRPPLPDDELVATVESTARPLARGGGEV